MATIYVTIRSRRMRLLRARPALRDLLRRVVARAGGHWIWADPSTEATAARDLWAGTYPGQPLPPNPCPQPACVRPSHRH